MFEVPDETVKLQLIEIGEENNDAIQQNDTVIVIESSEEEVTNRKLTEAELLKTSLYNDLGLYFNDVMKGEVKVNQPPKDLHVDHSSRAKRNIIWVNPVFPEGDVYEPIDAESRNPFILRVFSIVLINLLICILFQILVINVEFFTLLFTGLQGIILGIVGAVLIMIADYILTYDYAKTCPCSGIAWVMVVVGSCCILATMVVKVEVKELIIAFVATLAVVLMCIGLACTSFDFTRYILYVAVVGLVLFVFSIGTSIMYFIFRIKFKILNLILSCLWAMYHSVTLIIELQMVIGGRSVEIDASEYVFGGLVITLSIVYLFISLLKIVLYATSE